MSHRITLIPGDGIGPEITDAVLRIIKACGVEVEWDRHDAGLVAFRRHGMSLPKTLLDSVTRNRVALKGPITTPIAEGFTSVNVGLRKALDLYANVRPVYRLPGVKTRFDNVDLVIVRENTEDLYSGLEHEVVPGVVESLKIITARASDRIASFAFRYAREHGRPHVTAVHKANIMKLSDGLFLESRAPRRSTTRTSSTTNASWTPSRMQLVMYPERFDILVMPNLYGDIISDLCAGLVGGLGVVPGANLGVDNAVFEAVHGSAPDIADHGIANPTALLLSAVMMLRHIEEGEAADRITKALGEVLEKGEVRTKDLGGHSSTRDYTDAICDALR